MTTDLAALGLAVKRTQYRNHRAVDHALREVGVTLVQWDALRAIDRMPHASAHDLALATFQSDQAFGTLATRLVSRGLIARSAGRGRRIEHILTESGRVALKAGEQISSDVLRQLFSPLSAQQHETLAELLEELR